MTMLKGKKGAASRFYDKSHVAKHREWRGLRDTGYDFLRWVMNLGAMAQFVTASPVRIMKGLLQYRWFGTYLASFNWVDEAMEGLRGPALRISHTYMHTMLKEAMKVFVEMLNGDRRFGENDYDDRQVLLEQAMSVELVAGFPNLTPLLVEPFMGLMGAFVDQQLPAYYLDVMERFGLPSDSCRLSANAAGVAVSDDFPHNGACLIVNNMPCDSSTMKSRVIERRLELPVLAAALPMRWEDENTDVYAVTQMKAAIRFIEEHTGEAFDEKAFMDMMGKHNAEVLAERERLQLMRSEHAPFGGMAVHLFHIFLYAFSGGRVPSVLKTEEKCRRIAEKAIRRNINCMPKGRHRMLSWGGPACYNFPFPLWLYNCWGIVQIAEMDTFEGGVLIPTDSLESALVGVVKNFESSVMRRHLTGGYEHLLEFWEKAEEMNCDMVMMNDDITCKGALGLSGVIAESEKGHPNIHVMWISNDMFDHRTISRQDMRDQVNEYMTTVMREEPLDESLLVFDDYEGW